ncbi:MAG: type II toxin-antitoxin system VapC family toxin [Elusimicrobia bacterium]|nr:type II toxin-antitoxin system VapC family toxin [Elusimicrobiota bacterium]
MSDIILDSDVIIEVLRGNEEVTEEVIRLGKSGHAVLYTPVSEAEIYHGIRGNEAGKAEALFSGCASVPITDTIGEKAGHYLRQFHKSHGTGLADALIAAATCVNNAELFTLNHKHYPMKDIKIYKI